jgi:hypothetical protein
MYPLTAEGNLKLHKGPKFEEKEFLKNFRTYCIYCNLCAVGYYFQGMWNFQSESLFSLKT